MRKSIPSGAGSLKARLPAVSAGQKIGLLGGSFNPPHQGHRQITETALKKLGLDAVWWIVTPGNPLKNNDALPDFDDRLRLCRQFMRHPRVRITGVERHLATPYSAATIQFLKARRPGVKFVWLMGADNLASFHHWQQWRDIARLLPIAVIDRPGWHLRSLSSPAARAFVGRWLPEQRARLLPGLKTPAFSFLTGPLSPLSSSQIRA